jgi:hypothetical protein
MLAARQRTRLSGDGPKRPRITLLKMGGRAGIWSSAPSHPKEYLKYHYRASRLMHFEKKFVEGALRANPMGHIAKKTPCIK